MAIRPGRSLLSLNQEAGAFPNTNHRDEDGLVFSDEGQLGSVAIREFQPVQQLCWEEGLGFRQRLHGRLRAAKNLPE